MKHDRRILEALPTVDQQVMEKIMSSKVSDVPVTQGASEEIKDQNVKYVLSKLEYDLYHEEDDIANKVVRVKRFSLPNKGERWKMMVDNKVIFTVEGSKLSNKEREFLRTIDGVNFLISECKKGIKSFNALKKEIKKQLK